MTSTDFERIGAYPADPDVVEQVIEESDEGFLAWVAGDGGPRVTTITHVVIDGEIYYTSIPDRGKIRAMSRDPRVSVAFTGRATTLRRPINVTVNGAAGLVEEEPLRTQVMRAVADKLYVDESARARRNFTDQFVSRNRVSVHVARTSVSSFDWLRMAATVHDDHDSDP